jgi:hypothetical protein
MSLHDQKRINEMKGSGACRLRPVRRQPHHQNFIESLKKPQKIKMVPRHLRHNNNKKLPEGLENKKHSGFNKMQGRSHRLK